MSEPIDFEYQVNDSLALKTAYEKMVEVERSSFWYGVVAGFGAVVVLRRTTRLQPWSRNLLGLYGGSCTYSFLTHQSREQYGVVAARINRDSAQAISNIMKY